MKNMKMPVVLLIVMLVGLFGVSPTSAQDGEPLVATLTQFETALQRLNAGQAGDLHTLSRELTALIRQQRAEPYAALYDRAEALDAADYQTTLEDVRALVAEFKATVTRNTDDEPAAPTLTLSGQIRHRSEVNGKVDLADSGAPRYHLLRTRINVSFTPLDDIKVFIQVQDSRLFGGEDPAKGRGTLDGNADALDFHQAYFAVDNLFGTAFRLKVGRQELAYGNQRLVGSVGWSNVGRTFDAAVAAYRTDAVSVDVFTAQLQGSTVNTFSQNIHGLYSTFRLAEAHLADVFVLLDDNRDVVADGPEAGTKKLQRYTLGAYLHGKPAPFDYAFEAVYQSGKMALSDAQERASIGAYLVSGALGLTIDKAKKLRLGAHYTRLSGDDNPADGAARTFNTLFATNHKFYGFMDYFPRTFSPYGLQDVAFSVSLNPAPALGIKVDLHHFASERGIDTTGQQGLGQEIDLSVKYKYNDSFSLAAGASLFLADEVMKPVIGNDTASWFYLMSVVNF